MASHIVPLYRPNPKEGSIEYLAPKAALDAAEGFFSFTFYIRDDILGERTPKGAHLYLKGLNYYRSLLSKAPFNTWKLLIYTDKSTFENLLELQKKDLSTLPQSTRSELSPIKEFSGYLFRDPAVVFAIVTWPKHQKRLYKPSINGSALRPMRSRAPFDFPDKFIFIRDADTTFDEELKRLNYGGLYRTENDKYNKEAHDKVKEEFAEKIYTWEKSFFEILPQIQKYLKKDGLLIIGTGSVSPWMSTYKREWHINELEEKDAPFGIFAGYVSVTPGVPVYKTMEAWDEFIEYVNARSVRKNNTPTSMFERNYSHTKEPLTAAQLNALKEEVIARYKNRNAGEKAVKAKLDNIFYSFSNNDMIYSIGRDEQLYLFNIMPKSIDNLFIYHYDLGSAEDAQLDITYDTEMKKKYVDELVKGFKKAKGGKQQKTRKEKKQKHRKQTRKA
jgi:hypothetical protein